MRKGRDITIIAIGDVMNLALKAHNRLQDIGISARVIDMHTIKPIDESAIKAAMKETRGIVTIEDHNIIGGLGSTVCEVVGENGGCPVYRLGIRDKFGESGPYDVLLRKHKITTDEIVSKAKILLK